MAAQRKPRGATRRAVAETTKLADAQAAVREPVRSRQGPGEPFSGELRRREVLPLLVMHLMSGGPSYGNQLMDRISELTEGVLSVNPNTMYPLLRQLEARGLIEGRWEHPERRSRRYYSLTPRGRRSTAGCARTCARSSSRWAGRSTRSCARSMAATSAARRVELDPDRAWALWTDVQRWAAFVEGFSGIAERSPDWPAEGARVVWTSTPGGRGRVSEKVKVSERPARFATRVFEEALSGVQLVDVHGGR